MQALENRLDPVIGRSREVARVMQILARRRKNNPMLLGEPGVGKTAIAEGLALAIVNGKGDDGAELPPFLQGGHPNMPPAVLSVQAFSGMGPTHQRNIKSRNAGRSCPQSGLPASHGTEVMSGDAPSWAIHLDRDQ